VLGKQKSEQTHQTDAFVDSCSHEGIASSAKHLKTVSTMSNDEERRRENGSQSAGQIEKFKGERSGEL
jgi:hypothetical protein